MILNHIIIFYNVFEMEAATKMLFYRMEDKFKPLLKTFLVYLNYFPDDESVYQNSNGHKSNTNTQETIMKSFEEFKNKT